MILGVREWTICLFYSMVFLYEVEETSDPLGNTINKMKCLIECFQEKIIELKTKYVYWKLILGIYRVTSRILIEYKINVPWTCTLLQGPPEMSLYLGWFIYLQMCDLHHPLPFLNVVLDSKIQEDLCVASYNVMILVHCIHKDTNASLHLYKKKFNVQHDDGYVNKLTNTKPILFCLY